MVLPDHPTSRSPLLDHVGLAAGLVDALGSGDVRDHAPHHNPALRDLTVGEAVNAMVRNGRGCLTQARALVPRVLPHQPTSQRMSPRVASKPRHEDALGRALEPRDAAGVTARDRLRAATAVPRVGRAPRVGQLDRPRFQVEGRDNRDAEPDAPVRHRTRGSCRDQRPDCHPVLRDVRVEPQAGLPVLMTPRRGHHRAAHDGDQLLPAPMAPWPITAGTTGLVADAAR
jgi:hypothetical protein